MQSAGFFIDVVGVSYVSGVRRTSECRRCSVNLQRLCGQGVSVSLEARRALSQDYFEGELGDVLGLRIVPHPIRFDAGKRPHRFEVEDK